METIDVKYTSFAIPPTGIIVGRTYKFGKDKNGCYVSDASITKYFAEDEIKALFSPVLGSWEAKKATKSIEK